MILNSERQIIQHGCTGADLIRPCQTRCCSLTKLLKKIVVPIIAAAAVTGCSYGLTQKGIDSSPASKTVTAKGSVREVYQSLAQEMQGPGCPPIHSSKLYGNGDGFVVYFGENFIGHSYI